MSLPQLALLSFAKGGFFPHGSRSTYLKTCGNGRPLLVVHGGPGLEHSYLFPWLLPLAKLRTIIFYDQHGCGNDRTPATEISVNLLIDQLRALVGSLDGESPYDIIAHSWGAYLVLRAILHGKISRPNRLILISPVGLTAERSAGAVQRLIERIPANVMKEYEMDLSTSEADSCLRALKRIVPYYCANSTHHSSPEFGAYCPDVEASVEGSLGDCDLRGVDVRDVRKLLVYGTHDFESPANTREIQDHNCQIEVLPDAGHFCFSERSTEFLKVTTKFLRD